MYVLSVTVAWSSRSTWLTYLKRSFHQFGVGWSSIFWRLALCSSSSSWLRTPLTASGPKRDMCLLVIWRPALSFGPQCLSGFGRKRATFLVCALLRDATALAKLACQNKKNVSKRIFSHKYMQKHIQEWEKHTWRTGSLARITVPDWSGGWGFTGWFFTYTESRHNMIPQPISEQQ